MLYAVDGGIVNWLTDNFSVSHNICKEINFEARQVNELTLQLRHSNDMILEFLLTYDSL